MREIKFRVWDVGRKRMWYPEKDECYVAIFGGGIGWGLYDGKDQHRIVTGDPNAIFNTPGVLMQFTGLKDKIRLDIYEGDILRCRRKVGAVTFEFGSFMWLSNPISYDMDDGGSIKPTSDWAKVIGNIYQHKKLLKK